jgi:hypothetical protein
MPLETPRASGPAPRLDRRDEADPEEIPSKELPRLQNTRPGLRRCPQQRRSSVLAAFFNQILNLEAAQHIALTKGADAVDGRMTASSRFISGV